MSHPVPCHRAASAWWRSNGHPVDYWHIQAVHGTSSFRLSFLVAWDHGVVGVDVALAAVHLQRAGSGLGAEVGDAGGGGAAPRARLASEARAGADAVHVA